MSELPLFSNEIEPIMTIKVDTPTVFALREYMGLRGISLGQSMRDLIMLGLAVHECVAEGGEIIDQYPDGIQPYEADEAIFDEVEAISEIQTDLKGDMQIVLHSIADDLGIDRDAAFAHLVEDARDLYIKDKKGAELFRINPDGKVARLTFVYKDRDKESE